MTTISPALASSRSAIARDNRPRTLAAWAGTPRSTNTSPNHSSTKRSIGRVNAPFASGPMGMRVSIERRAP